MTLPLRVATRFAILGTNMGSPDGSHSKDFAQKIRSQGEKNEEEERAEAWVEHKTATEADHEAMEFPNEDAYRKYLNEHPKADKSKHTVKKAPTQHGPEYQAAKEVERTGKEMEMLVDAVQRDYDSGKPVEHNQKALLHKTNEYEHHINELVKDVKKLPRKSKEKMEADDTAKELQHIFKEWLGERVEYQNPTITQQALRKTLALVKELNELLAGQQVLDMPSGSDMKRQRHGEELVKKLRSKGELTVKHDPTGSTFVVRQVGKNNYAIYEHGKLKGQHTMNEEDLWRWMTTLEEAPEEKIEEEEPETPHRPSGIYPKQAYRVAALFEKKLGLDRYAALPANHLMKNPAGTWSFVGNVDARLSFLRKDGNEITDSPEDQKAIQDARQFGPGLAKVKTRVFKTPFDAFEAAKKLGQSVTLAQWEMDKHPEIAEGLKRSGVKHKINP